MSFFTILCSNLQTLQCFCSLTKDHVRGSRDKLGGQGPDQGFKSDQGPEEDVLYDGELGQNLPLVHFEQALVDFRPGWKSADVPQLVWVLGEMACLYLRKIIVKRTQRKMKLKSNRTLALSEGPYFKKTALLDRYFLPQFRIKIDISVITACYETCDFNIMWSTSTCC